MYDYDYDSTKNAFLVCGGVAYAVTFGGYYLLSPLLAASSTGNIVALVLSFAVGIALGGIAGLAVKLAR